MAVASSTGRPNTETMTIVTHSASSRPLEEAMAVADTALALAGYEVPQFVRDLEARIARGEITADEAVAQIIARHTGADRQPLA
jgi:Antitoxin VbhA